MIGATGRPYNFDALLQADYILYTARQYSPSSANYSNAGQASVRFLVSPPLVFADAHEVVASFDSSKGTARLIKRTKPVTAVEAERSIEALEVAEKYKVTKFEVLAPLYAIEGNIEKGAALYEELLQQPPDTLTRIVKNRKIFETFRSLGSVDQEVVFYEKLLESGSGYLWARLGLAKVHAETGNVQAAIAQLETAIAQAPDKALPRQRLASLIQSQGDDERAAALYREILEFDPNNIAVKRALAKIER